jgi:hypothetical protein
MSRASLAPPQRKPRPDLAGAKGRRPARWDEVAGTERDYRDYRLGQHPAAGARKEIVTEILEAFSNANWLVAEKAERKDCSATFLRGLAEALAKIAA